MKVGLCSVPPAGHPASLLSLINSTSMSLMVKDVVHQFDKLYKKKVIHHLLQKRKYCKLIQYNSIIIHLN